jgi:hypothetical protein
MSNKTFNEKDLKNIKVYLAKMLEPGNNEADSARRFLNSTLKNNEVPIAFVDTDLANPAVRKVLERYAENPDLFFGEGDLAGNKELEDSLETARKQAAEWERTARDYANAYQAAAERCDTLTDQLERAQEKLGGRDSGRRRSERERSRADANQSYGREPGVSEPRAAREEYAAGTGQYDGQGSGSGNSPGGIGRRGWVVAALLATASVLVYNLMSETTSSGDKQYETYKSRWDEIPGLKVYTEGKKYEVMPYDMFYPQDQIGPEKQCDDLVAKGHDDWTLPSFNVMVAIADKLHPDDMHGFFDKKGYTRNPFYWTSEPGVATYLYDIYKPDYQERFEKYRTTLNPETDRARVRCVRLVDATTASEQEDDLRTRLNEQGITKVAFHGPAENVKDKRCKDTAREFTGIEQHGLPAKGTACLYPETVAADSGPEGNTEFSIDWQKFGQEQNITDIKVKTGNGGVCIGEFKSRDSWRITGTRNGEAGVGCVTTDDNGSRRWWFETPSEAKLKMDKYIKNKENDERITGVEFHEKALPKKEYGKCGEYWQDPTEYDQISIAVDFTAQRNGLPIVGTACRRIRYEGGFRGENYYAQTFLSTDFNKAKMTTELKEKGYTEVKYEKIGLSSIQFRGKREGMSGVGIVSSKGVTFEHN